MKKRLLKTDQIIAIPAYPRNVRIIELYYRMFKKGGVTLVPPCPVVSKRIIMKMTKRRLSEKTENRLLLFLKRNPSAAYQPQ